MINRFVIILSMGAMLNLGAQSSGKSQETVETGVAYALPKTSLLVQVKYIRECAVKGPFARYARQYLGFNQVIQEDALKYRVLDVTIENIVVPDEYFVYNPDRGDINFDFISKLHDQGFILYDLRSPVVKLNTQAKFELPCGKINYIPFENLYKDVIDTTFKREYRDTGWMNVPYYNRKYVLKKEEDHARDAANQLIWMHEKRIKSAARLDPEEDAPVDVSEALFEEINILILQYTELFTGRVMSDTLEYTVIITPEPGKDDYTLFYYSEDGGISDNGKANEKATMQIKYEGPEIAIPRDRSRPSNNAQLLYRVPVRAATTIVYKNETLYKGVHDIYQYGKTSAMPPRAPLMR